MKSKITVLIALSGLLATTTTLFPSEKETSTTHNAMTRHDSKGRRSSGSNPHHHQDKDKKDKSSRPGSGHHTPQADSQTHHPSILDKGAQIISNLKHQLEDHVKDINTGSDSIVNPSNPSANPDVSHALNQSVKEPEDSITHKEDKRIKITGTDSGTNSPKRGTESKRRPSSSNNSKNTEKPNITNQNATPNNNNNNNDQQKEKIDAATPTNTYYIMGGIGITTAAILLILYKYDKLPNFAELFKNLFSSPSQV